MEEKYIELGGKRVFYRHEVGEARENVLLLHGMRFTSRNWAEIDALRKIHQWGYNTYAVDFPGFGLSEENEKYIFSSADYSPSSLFVKDFCEKLAINRVIIIGPSMGGAIAIRSIIDFPGLVKEIIVIAPAGFEALRGDLYRIDGQVHIIWGSEDSTIELSFGRRYHDLIAGSDLHIIKGADHVPYLKKTSQFFSLIKKFLYDE